MKKIVSILAVAVMAASMFAADVSAHIQLDGTVLGKNGDGVGAIQLKKLDPTADQPNFTLSGSGDKAGATISNYAGTDAHDVLDSSFMEWNVWFKPFDALKVTAGHYELKLNNPHFGWWASAFTLPDYGFVFDYAAGDFTATVAFGSANGEWTGDPWNYAYGTYWFDSTADKKIADFEAILGYNLGDAGNIKAAIGKGVRVCPHGFSIGNAWKRTPLAMAIGYSNQPWGQTGYFADVAVVFDNDNKFNELDSQLYFEFHKDSLVLYLIDCVAYNAPNKKFKDGFEFKAEYALGTCTPYLQITGYDIMDKKCNVRPGVTGSVGTMSYDLAVSIDVADTIGWSVPFQFTIGF